uniref:Hypothetical mobile element protein n=1 Tax=Saccharolobus solfataricus (strain ATCC 35092 / DSM 1617 / JCM 11322 / P2) TaxID=273057 RepID=S6DRL0_SACS2|nr:hypothetical mobile element protein [Saccharolobus solfataricus P2]
MIKCRDLALNHPFSGSWDSLEPNGTGLTSLYNPSHPFGHSPHRRERSSFYQQKHYKRI